MATIVDHRTKAPIDSGAPDRADYRDLGRWERRILRHMLLALALGLGAGTAGGLLHIAGLAGPAGFFDPYVYLVLAALVGATATGPGWALLGTLLLAVGPVSSATVVGGLLGGVDPQHGVLDVAAHPELPAPLTIVVTVLAGLAAHLLYRACNGGRRGRRSR